MLLVGLSIGQFGSGLVQPTCDPTWSGGAYLNSLLIDEVDRIGWIWLSTGGGQFGWRRRSRKWLKFGQIMAKI